MQFPWLQVDFDTAYAVPVRSGFAQDSKTEQSSARWSVIGFSTMEQTCPRMAILDYEKIWVDLQCSRIDVGQGVVE